MIHTPCILCNLVREQLSDRHKFRICAICRWSAVLFPNITRYHIDNLKIRYCERPAEITHIFGDFSIIIVPYEFTGTGGITFENPQFVYIALSAIIRRHVVGSFPSLVLGQVVDNLLLPVVVVARFLDAPVSRERMINDK